MSFFESYPCICMTQKMFHAWTSQDCCKQVTACANHLLVSTVTRLAPCKMGPLAHGQSHLGVLGGSTKPGTRPHPIPPPLPLPGYMARRKRLALGAPC